MKSCCIIVSYPSPCIEQLLTLTRQGRARCAALLWVLYAVCSSLGGMFKNRVLRDGFNLFYLGAGNKLGRCVPVDIRLASRGVMGEVKMVKHDRLTTSLISTTIYPCQIRYRFTGWPALWSFTPSQATSISSAVYGVQGDRSEVSVSTSPSRQ